MIIFSSKSVYHVNLLEYKTNFRRRIVFWNELEESLAGNMWESSEDGSASRHQDSQPVPGRREARFPALPAVIAEEPAGGVSARGRGFRSDNGPERFEHWETELQEELRVEEFTKSTPAAATTARSF